MTRRVAHRVQALTALFLVYACVGYVGGGWLAFATTTPPLMRTGLFPDMRICRDVLVIPECIDLAAPERCAPRRELRCQ